MITNLHEFGKDTYVLPHLLDNVIDILQMQKHDKAILGGKIYQNHIVLSTPEKLAVIGDLHGDIQALNHIIAKINAEKFFDNPKNKLVFLGDYIDRGSSSIEVLCKICKLKIQHPDSVILMRGNHEAVARFPFPGHDLPTKIAEVFGTSKELVYDKILWFFELLADVVIVEKKIFFVHGGLPVDAIDSDNIDILLESASQQKLEDFLWNDPRDIEAWEVSHRKFGKHFGKSVTKKWLDASNTCVLVRGHEPCQGFKIDHDKMILTIFSCKESYPNFDAGYLLIKDLHLEKIRNAVDLSEHVIKING